MEQPAYNALERQKVEGEYAHLYREIGLGLTVFSPMRAGILSGKYNNGIPEDSRYGSKGISFIKDYWKQEKAKKQFEAWVEKARKLAPVAERLGIKQSTLALAWVLKNPNVSSAITGASSPEQVYENVRAVAAVELLTNDVMEEIEGILENKPAEIIKRF